MDCQPIKDTIKVPQTYLLNRVKRCKAFPRSTYIIHVFNTLPTDKRHIKVPQDRLLNPTHVDNCNVLILIRHIVMNGAHELNLFLFYYFSQMHFHFNLF